MGEAADIWAKLGLRLDNGAWAKGDAALAGVKRATDALTGAYADKNGRWRAANGRFLSIAEKAELAKRGVEGVGDATNKAGRKASQASKQFAGVGTALGAIGAYLGARAAFSGLIKFNATAEDARNQIAGMLALVKKTDLADQLGAADNLVSSLTKRAATLPGTTAEYVAMLGMITQPVIDAKLGLKDLEDLTVGSVVAAKALGVEWETAARDVDQAIRGQFKASDQLTGKLLGAAGFKGETGRARFNALPADKRAQEIKKALTQKQIVQLAEAQGKTFSGVLSTLQDGLQQFFGKVGKPLFEGLTAAIKDANQWLDANKETVTEVAAAIAGALVVAFDALGSVLGVVATAIRFFVDNAELGQAVIIALGVVIAAFAVQAAIAWVVAFAPIIAVIAAIAAVTYAFLMLRKHPEKVKAAFRAMWQGIKDGANAFWNALKAVGNRIVTFFAEDIPNAIIAAFKAAFEFIANLPVIKQMRWLIGAARDLMGEDDVPIGPMLQDALNKWQDPLNGAGAQQQSMIAPRSSSVTVDVGGISVSSAKADPKAVAVEVGRAVDERLASMLRQTMDVVG